MILRKCEADILDYLREGMNHKQIAERLGLDPNRVTRLVHRLKELSVIDKINSKYVFLINDFEIIQDNSAMHSRQKLEPIIIPAGYEKFIREHYEKIPRREIARRLKIDKVTLNKMLIQLGCGA